MNDGNPSNQWGGQVRIVEASSTIGGTFENKAYKERA